MRRPLVVLPLLAACELQPAPDAARADRSLPVVEVQAPLQGVRARLDAWDPVEAVVARTLLPFTRVDGVTADPDDGQRYVIVDQDGFWRLDGAGWPTEQLFTSGPETELTDVAALGGGAFAITIPGVGMRWRAGEAWQEHFCYEPGGWETGETGWSWDSDTGADEPVEPQVPAELTWAVAYDPDLDQIFAQPWRPAANTSFLGSWSAPLGGQPITWTEFDRDGVVAGGLASVSPGTLLMAEGTRLFRVRAGDPDAVRVFELAPLGIGPITGLDLDRHTNTLLVTHSDPAELIELALPRR